jgi:hypothetical protein
LKSNGSKVTTASAWLFQRNQGIEQYSPHAIKNQPSNSNPISSQFNNWLSRRSGWQVQGVPVIASATSKGRHRTVLLLLPASKQMFPLSTAALTQAQAPRSKLENDYADAYLLDADGFLCRIERIHVLGPSGDGWARRLLSRLTQGWRISVQLSGPVDWGLERRRGLVLQCLIAQGEEPEPTVAAVAGALERAANPAELFAALRLPVPEDALDVL